MGHKSRCEAILHTFKNDPLRSLHHNSLAELTAWTDAKAQGFSMTYDALSRPATRTEGGVTTTWTWGNTAASFNIGQLAGVSVSGYSDSYSFDNKGRVSQRSVTAGSTFLVDYAYTSLGTLDTLTYPTSTSSTRVKVKYGYQNGILKSVTDYTTGSAGTVYWTANAQNPRGQTTQEVLGNGVVTNRALDAVTGWMASVQSGVGGGAALQNQSYLYDLVGNVTQRQESNLGLTENFYLDNLYRLDHSTLNGATNLSLTYDAMGNILTKSDVGGGATWTYDTPTRKHAVKTAGSGNSYSYDANGNMTSRNGSSIGWTAYNYPSSLAAGSESTSFYYTPNREYYKQVYTGPGGTETTLYIGGVLEQVVLPGGTTDWRHYVYAEGQAVAIISRKSTGTNAVSYPLEDHQGSAAVLTNASGASIVKESFTAFGAPRSGSSWSGAVPSGDKTLIAGISRRGYTYHSMLGDMGLIHMNGRVQDAITGRFLSPDPTIPDPGFTQSFNRYAYVNNNPLSYIDPSGFSLADLFKSLCNYLNMCPAVPVTPALAELEEVTVTGQRPTDVCDLACQEQQRVEAAALNRQYASDMATQVTRDNALRELHGDRLPQDLGNYFEKAAGGNLWGALKAGLSMIGHSWKDAYSTKERAVLTTMSMVPLVGTEANVARAEYNLTRTVENNLATRPYLNSPLTIGEIRATGAGVPDPGGIPGAVRYDVPGSFNGSQGNYELVVHPDTNTIYHFVFKGN